MSEALAAFLIIFVFLFRYELWFLFVALAKKLKK